MGRLATWRQAHSCCLYTPNPSKRQLTRTLNPQLRNSYLYIYAAGGGSGIARITGGPTPSPFPEWPGGWGRAGDPGAGGPGWPPATPATLARPGRDPAPDPYRTSSSMTTRKPIWGSDERKVPASPFISSRISSYRSGFGSLYRRPRRMMYAVVSGGGGNLIVVSVRLLVHSMPLPAMSRQPKGLLSREAEPTGSGPSASRSTAISVLSRGA